MMTERTETMELIENFLANGTEITFSILFIGLFIYMIKTNDGREQRYQETISKLTTALNGYEDLKEDVAYIRQKVG